jgi:hypothetical protein
MHRTWKWLIALCIIAALVSCAKGMSTSTRYLTNGKGYQCSVPMPIFKRAVYVDEKFTPVQVVLLSEAMAKWRRSTVGFVDYEIKGSFKHNKFGSLPEFSSESVYIFYGSSDDPEGKRDPMILGSANRTSIDIVMDRIVDSSPWDRKLVGVTMHEIGHTIGIGHIKDEPDALMAPICSTACSDPQITIYDLTAMCNSAFEQAKSDGWTHNLRYSVNGEPTQ